MSANTQKKSQIWEEFVKSLHFSSLYIANSLNTH